MLLFLATPVYLFLAPKLFRCLPVYIKKFVYKAKYIKSNGKYYVDKIKTKIRHYNTVIRPMIPYTSEKLALTN